MPVMKIVKQSARLENPGELKNALKLIERAGRTCYQSEPKGKPEEFVAMLIRRGHESVLEHAKATVRVVTDRGVSHEIVRHRIASYSQESTRYCRYKGGIVVIEPPNMTDAQLAEWAWAATTCEKAYLSLLQEGASPQIARSVLPTCLKTELVITMNLREWRHFLKLRLAPSAHPQMRELAGVIQTLLASKVPVVFDHMYLGVSC